ncbi:hypothetical protein MNBD_GAMMA05-658 [hydrothermal vent metagenome]|uniref:Uncharacterized protein n=1 Tax=hydrothermal vent metagenome TaxID=652676 RepID=A0A3B0X5V7_9ZZZZ
MAKYDSIYEGRIPSAVISDGSENVLVKHHCSRFLKLLYFLQLRLSIMFKQLIYK